MWLERGAQAVAHLLDLLDPAARDRDHAEDHLGAGKALQQGEIVRPVRVLDRDRVDRDLVEPVGEREVRLVRRLGIVLGIEPVGVAAADVHHALRAGRHLVEAALEVLEAEGQRVLDLAREHRLVDLDHRAAGIGEAADLDVQRIGERGAARARVVR